ncbi:lipopolysaccharide assembly protein LapB [Nostoc sp. FACHB-190]|uniref:tetratricopeptide repeat protein n=1 Tax=Nostoc sp. FACHB-190 TaxID=2692838 RepID=UPI0016873F97|nr:tetratricopeptide repeat protein [Nostoc sp. FACHB-190]MBD2297248.1 tetratricopeptide repeat protein [Nostoc sp. FACHB-190]
MQIQLFHYKFPGKILWVLITAPILFIIPLYLNSQPNSPYRYNFSLSLPGTENSRATLQQEIAFYQTKLRQSPDSGLNLTALAQAYLKMAKATGESNWYLLAEQAANRSLSHLPFHNQGAILVLARVAQARHDFAAAIRLSQQVLQSQPTNDHALAILVTSNLATGNLTAARTAADALVNKIPTQGNLTLQALVLVAQGQDQAAIATFKNALATEEPGELGTSAWTRVVFGQFYDKRGQPDLASSLYKEALRIIPRYPLALLHLAELAMRQGNYQQAESLYAQVLPNSQTSSTIFDHAVFRGRAKVLQLQGKATAAQTLLTQAESLLRQENAGHTNGSFGHRRELARLLLEKNRPQDTAEALSLMQAEIKIRRDAQTLDTLAWALFRVGRFREAQQQIQAALQLGTRDAGMFYRAGIIAKALGNQQQALNYQQLAQSVDPTFNAKARLISGLGLDNLGI